MRAAERGPAGGPAKERGGWIDVALAAAALALLLPGISAPFWNRDEAIYAVVARGMARGGEFSAPSLFGRPFAGKPPLSLWLTAASFRWIGVSEAAGRLPHVARAVLAVLLVRRLAARLVPGGRGVPSAAILASSLLWVVYARLLLTDSALLFFDLAAMLGLLSLEEPRLRAAPLAGAGAALGLAALAKGPVAFAAPALFAAGAVSGGVPARREIARFGFAAAIGAAIAAPWWLRAPGSGAAFFGRENLGRFLAPMEHHSGPVVYYLPVVLLGLFPWTGFLAIRSAWRMDGTGRRAAIWAGGIAAFFSISATKLPHYLLPALPALAILAARGSREAAGGRLRAAAWIAAGTGAFLFAAACSAACRVEFPALFLPAVAACGATAALSLAAPLAAGTRGGGLAASVLAAASVPLFLPAALERGRALAFLGRAASVAAKSGEPVGGWRFEEPALVYYARADASRKWKDAEGLAVSVRESASRSALVWVAGRDAPALAREGKVALRVLAARANLVETGPKGEILLCRARLPAWLAPRPPEAAATSRVPPLTRRRG